MLVAKDVLGGGVCASPWPTKYSFLQMPLNLPIISAFLSSSLAKDVYVRLVSFCALYDHDVAFKVFFNNVRIEAM